MRPRGPRKPESGAVAVEFALVLPILLLLILGGVDWGYYFFISEIVGNAAREGARAGSVSRTPLTACDTDGTVEVTVRDYLQRGQVIGGSGDQRLRAFNCADPVDSCCELVPIPSTASTNNAVRVRVAYQLRPGSMSITGYLPAQLLPPLATTTATMRLEP